MCNAHTGKTLLTKDLPPEVERAVRGFFDDYTSTLDPLREDVVDAIEDGVIDPTSLSSVEVEVERLAGNYTSDVQEVYRAGTQAGSEVGRELAARRHQLDVAFDVVPEDVLREFSEWSDEIVGSEVMETITDETTTYIRAAQEEGIGTDEIARQVNDELFDGRLQGYQARANARTATISSSNAGSHSTYEDANGVVAEEWIIGPRTGPNAPRPTHATAGGQTVAVGQTFIVGNSEARYPADPGLPPDEIIQCRCTSVPVFANELTESQLARIEAGERIWR